MQLKCNIYSIDSDLTSKNMIHFVLEVKMENQSNADNKSQLSNLVNQPMPEKQKQTSVLLIVLALLVFFPVGIYLLWKEKKLHVWFPNLLILLSVLNILPALSIMIFVMPKILKLYQDFGINYNNNNSIILGSIVLALSLIEIITGFILRKKVQPDGSLENKFILTCVTFFITEFIPVGIFVMTAVLPIYNLTSQF